MTSDNCHLVVTGRKLEQFWAKICSDFIWESNSVKFLGINIDSQLGFDNHISLLCPTAYRKLSATASITFYLTFHKKKKLKVKSFFVSLYLSLYLCISVTD